MEPLALSPAGGWRERWQNAEHLSQLGVPHGDLLTLVPQSFLLHVGEITPAYGVKQSRLWAGAPLAVHAGSSHPRAVEAQGSGLCPACQLLGPRAPAVCLTCPRA